MLKDVPSFDKLVHELGKLPGIGHKTAQRLAYYVLRSPAEYSSELSEALHSVKASVKECPTCFSYTENEDQCKLCASDARDNSVVCVVEEPADISRIESSGAFNGRYHVLHGALSPLDGITPSDIRIQPLMDKIQKGVNGEAPVIEEVILALDADLEGDTTVLYLAKILSEKGIKSSRIAHGVPIGGDIDYIDNRTLERALENRVQL